MLTIKRVPTVVSNFQEAAEALGCGRNCLGKCCLPGNSSAPLFDLPPPSPYAFACMPWYFLVVRLVRACGFLETFRGG